MKTQTILTILLASVLTAAAAPGGGSSAGGYTLHEWGTFTTLSASDGNLLPGVQREEEPLPEFIFTHDGMQHPDWMSAVKGWLRPVINVTVRMETPVIYFYTKEAFDAHVEVGWKGGSISQWYPDRSGGETPPPIKRHAEGWALNEENTLDFSKGYQGGIEWDVRVTPAGDDAAGRVFKPGETPSWIYPRLPDSALVTNKAGQTEKYLFYRGLGRISLPVSFSSSGPGNVAMKNTGAQPSGTMLIFELNDKFEARWKSVPALGAGDARTFSLNDEPFAKDWRAGIYKDGIAMLTGAGLYRKEADAMLQTWWPSYFERKGLRVFWVVPRVFTDATLPLTASPAPAETVRVLVGRSEILTPEFEQQLVTDFREAADKDRGNCWEHDRYFPAFAVRVGQLTKRTAAASPR